MDSQTMSKLPRIDLSMDKLKPGTKIWESTCKAIKEAMEEYGCFEAVNTNIPLELHNSMFSATKELFDLPIEIKSQKTSDKPFHSYYGQNRYEALGIDNATSIEATQHFTNTMWPNGNDLFCKSAHTIGMIMKEFDRMVTRMIFESYGVEKYYESQEESTNYLFKCFKYGSPLTEDETNIGLGAHTDKDFLSILHQHQVSGLQVKLNEEWIDITPSPSSLIFMAGDGLMGWSNDRIKPCQHQVIMKGKEARYSLGLFALSNRKIEIPKELVDENNPLKYNPFDLVDYLRFIQTPEGIKSQFPLKTFCGV